MFCNVLLKLFSWGMQMINVIHKAVANTCIHIHESESRSVMSDSLRPLGLYSPWNFPGQNTEVSSLSVLQGVFPTQGSNPGLPHCRRILYQLSHKGSPGILKWVTYAFSSGSSQPRNRTGVSCIAGDSLPIELWVMKPKYSTNVLAKWAPCI